MLVVFAGHTQEKRGKPEPEQNQSTGEKKRGDGRDIGIGREPEFNFIHS